MPLANSFDLIAPDSKITRFQVICAAMVLVGELRPGHIPSEYELQNAEFHLDCAIHEYHRMRIQSEYCDHSILSHMLAGRLRLRTHMNFWQRVRFVFTGRIP